MNHPEIEAMMKYGHRSRKELLSEIEYEYRYMEDAYGTEISEGDTYYESKKGELVHEDNFLVYVNEELDLEKKIR